MTENENLINLDNPKIQKIRDILSNVFDPEIPVLSIIDLGILRNIRLENEVFIIVITPTYNGCPAMNVIEWAMKAALDDAQIQHYVIHTILSPAWTTDWMTEEGKTKLREYGIAPPATKARIRKMFDPQELVSCPRCNSNQTHLVSEYGSTACKSMYRCMNCLEPFDYFKCH